MDIHRTYRTRQSRTSCSKLRRYRLSGQHEQQVVRLGVRVRQAVARLSQLAVESSTVMSRDSHLEKVPGFVAFHLLKGPEAEDHTLLCFSNRVGEPGCIRGMDQIR